MKEQGLGPSIAANFNHHVLVQGNNTFKTIVRAMVPYSGTRVEGNLEGARPIAFYYNDPSIPYYLAPDLGMDVNVRKLHDDVVTDDMDNSYGNLANDSSGTFSPSPFINFLWELRHGIAK